MENPVPITLTLEKLHRLIFFLELLSKYEIPQAKDVYQLAVELSAQLPIVDLISEEALITARSSDLNLVGKQ